VLAGVETEHLESLVGCLTALDGRDANTRALRPMTFAGGQWTVQQDIHLLSRHYWMKLTGKGRKQLTVHGKSNFRKNQARLARVHAHFL
jgi:hypothetical protein